jgi:hypothetical protein
MDLYVFARVLSFHCKSPSSAASAAVSAAAFVVLALFVAVAAAALMVFTFSVAAALFAFSVVMVIAVCASVHKFSAQICCDCLIRIAGSARADFDARISECVQRAAAKSAADQHLNVVVCQKTCQRAVSDPV